MEYRGHWAKAGMSLGDMSSRPSRSHTELLSGPYPFEYCEQRDLPPGAIFVEIAESIAGGKRCFDTLTYRQGPNGPELL